ncbi:MAG: hypothetical protein K1V95_02855 [Eubacterium sp.]
MKPFKINSKPIQPNTADTLKTKMLIEILKKQLTETDYQIIKCYEYSLAGKDLPYDITALHNERQALRDKINELQGGDEK